MNNKSSRRINWPMEGAAIFLAFCCGALLWVAFDAPTLVGVPPLFLTAINLSRPFAGD